MSKIERIHPELNPEDIPENEVLSKDSQAVPKEENVLSFKKAQRIFGRKQQNILKEEEYINPLDLHEYLIKEYSCDVDAHPRWCVWGKNTVGTYSVLFWIKPVYQDERVAIKISELMNGFGGETYAEKTEWNKTLEGEPIYIRAEKRANPKEN
ncbi:MAG: hypothetical protein HYT93_01965 [Parcubacteria group bacterium]|nr:hypothetical protein [Parcubacteria group bacterium]